MSLLQTIYPHRIYTYFNRFSAAIPRKECKKQSFSLLKACHQKEQYAERRTIQVRTFEVIGTILNLYVAIENIIIEKISCVALSPLLMGLHWLENNQRVSESNKKKENSTTKMCSDYYSIHNRSFIEQPEIKNDTDWGYFVSFQ